MDFQFRANRLEIEATEWNSKEDKLKKLFRSSPSVEQSILKEKLRWYESMLIKYRRTDHFEERCALRIIKKERSNLIKQIYPNKFGQFFYKALNLFIIEKVNTGIQIKNELKSNESLKDKLRHAGFKDHFNRVERYMRLGQIKFTVPVSYYLNEKEKIEHSLYFKKDEWGHYQFAGFKTRLDDQSKLSENRQHYFSVEEPSNFNAKQAYDLLSGRAVLKEEIWKQLDFNQKDGDENYRFKEFPESYGYNIEEVIAKLPLRISDQLDVNCLISSLKDGAREAAVLLKDGEEQKIFIEANPQYRSLNIYNESLKKISLVERKKKETVQLQKKSIESQVVKIYKGRGKSRSL